MTWLVLFLALAAGAANPFQSGANSELNKQLGQSIWAGIVVCLSGLLGLLLIQLILRNPFPAAKLPAVPWWAWLGGLISIAPTMAGLVLAQRLGSGIFTGASVTAAILVSVFLDQMGWVGFKQHAASPARLAGCALMIAGLWIIARF